MNTSDIKEFVTISMGGSEIPAVKREEVMQVDLVGENDPILLEKLPEFVFGNNTLDITSLFKAMTTIMNDQGGIGLAANQIGLKYRCFVMYSQELHRDIICFNPVVVEGWNMQRNREGCITFPGLALDIDRPTVVSVKFQDETGKHVETIFKDIDAIVFQHEYDHVNGVIFTHRTSILGLKMARNRQMKKLKKAIRSYKKHHGQ